MTTERDLDVISAKMTILGLMQKNPEMMLLGYYEPQWREIIKELFMEVGAYYSPRLKRPDLAEAFGKAMHDYIEQKLNEKREQENGEWDGNSSGTTKSSVH